MSSIELVVTQSLPGHFLTGNQSSGMEKVSTICNKWGQCGLTQREQNPRKAEHVSKNNLPFPSQAVLNSNHRNTEMQKWNTLTMLRGV